MPAEPIQLANSRLAWGVFAPSTCSGVISPCSSGPRAEVAGELGAVGPVLPVSEARLWMSLASSARLAPRWPRPIASHDSPGSSLSACALWGSVESRPAAWLVESVEPAVSLSTSKLYELGVATSETLASCAPASTPTSPDSSSPGVGEAPAAGLE